MNIGELARLGEVSPDTLRFYERQGLLSAPPRAANGYRDYNQKHLEIVRFVRGAQSLGFSLAEIKAILPQLAQGQLDRSQIEQRLTQKMNDIDAQIEQLHALKRELQTTFASLRCQPVDPLSTRAATVVEPGHGAGYEKKRRNFRVKAA